MNFLSRTLTGGILIALGLGLIGLSFFTLFVPLIYAIPILIVGVFILLNKKEDEIEQIKSERRSK